MSHGGPLRNHFASFLGGFQERIPQTDPMVLELRAAIRGLKMALQNGHDNVILETDSEKLRDFVLDIKTVTPNVLSLVLECRSPLDSFRCTRVTTTYREGNGAADCLAKRASSGHNEDPPYFVNPPGYLDDILYFDVYGDGRSP